jgi:DNA-binding IclR family transcriptional regulator
MGRSDVGAVKSAERALNILELFSRLDDSPLTFTQVAAKLGYPRSSLHGLLRTLTAHGWLQLDPGSRRFSLGLRAFEAGNAYRPAAELARHAAPVVQRLQAESQGSVQVAVLDGADTVVVAGSAFRLGRRATALASGAGKVLLADLDRGARERRISVGGDDVSALQQVHVVLDQVRDQGWGADDDEQPGRGAVAVPVRDRSGAVVAALGLCAPQLPEERRDETLRALRRGAAQISAGLGFAGAG